MLRTCGFSKKHFCTSFGFFARHWLKRRSAIMIYLCDSEHSIMRLIDRLLSFFYPFCLLLTQAPYIPGSWLRLKDCFFTAALIPWRSLHLQKRQWLIKIGVFTDHGFKPQVKVTTSSSIRLDVCLTGRQFL